MDVVAVLADPLDSLVGSSGSLFDQKIVCSSRWNVVQTIVSQVIFSSSKVS